MGSAYADEHTRRRREEGVEARRKVAENGRSYAGINEIWSSVHGHMRAHTQGSQDAPFSMGAGLIDLLASW